VAAASGLALIAAGLTPAAAHVTPRSGTAPVVRHYTGTTGVARLVPRTVRLGAGARGTFPKGARVLHTFSATERVPRAPAVAAARGAAATASPIVNFNGVSSRDSEFTNYNAEFEPPDQGLCEGNGFILEPVNSAYRVYIKSGKSIRGPFNINDLFNVGGQEFTSDPRCWYDPGSQTWFATILFLNSTGTQGTELIAVRHAKDPLGLWNEYSINATDPGGRGCPCFGDQPRIGIDQENLYITADQFSINGPQFDGGELWVINKAALVAGKPTVKFAHFGHITTGLTPQPALSTVKPHAEFMLGALDNTGQGASSISVWAITDRAAVASGGLPTVSSIVINSEAYANPPAPPQKGSSVKLNPDDDRMQDTEFAGNAIWGALTTAVTPAGDSAVRSGGAWFQVKVMLGGGVVTGAKIVRQGYIDAPGQYLIYPAVQPDAAGNAAAVFTESNAAEFPAAAYATLQAGASNFGPPVVAAAGHGSYSGGRWGDYSFAVPGPSDTAWLATEYVPPKVSQTTDGNANWGTRVFQVPLSAGS
jgi:hypothetical protein